MLGSRCITYAITLISYDRSLVRNLITTGGITFLNFAQSTKAYGTSLIAEVKLNLKKYLEQPKENC